MNPFDLGYYEDNDLRLMGFKALGRNVRIAKKCTIIGLENIEIGDNVRVDDFTTLVASAGGFLRIGSFVHIAGYCLLSAGGGIEIGDFGGLSHGVKLYSVSDDYTGRSLTNPTVPEKYKLTKRGLVSLQKHVIIGADSVVLPNVTIGEGSSIGALSLVTKSLEPWNVYHGIPAKKLKKRFRDLLNLEREFLGETSSS